MSRTVQVVGTGIIGLTTAVTLLEQGFQVQLHSDRPLLATLSSKVGAIWFPFEVHPAEKANRWGSISYHKYLEHLEPGSGVALLPFLTSYLEKSNNDWVHLLPKGSVRKALPQELPEGIERAFVCQVPLAEPHAYLPFLEKMIITLGGSFHHQQFDSLSELALLGDTVINCTGLGAKKLCQDNDLIPMRGQILRCASLDIPPMPNPLGKVPCLMSSNDPRTASLEGPITITTGMKKWIRRITSLF